MKLPSWVMRLCTSLPSLGVSPSIVCGALGVALLAGSLGGCWVGSQISKPARIELKSASMSIKADDAAEKVTIKAKAKVAKAAAAKRKEVKEVLDANEDWANQPVPAALADSLR